LSPALHEAFKDVDSIINLLKKVIHVEEPITIFACLKDDPSFPDRCEMCEIMDKMMDERGLAHLHHAAIPNLVSGNPTSLMSGHYP